MHYVGSKNRLSKELVPIIQEYITEETVAYVEPFVGGANMIDKIDHHNKIGYDIHPQVIALLKHVQNLDNDLPDTISEKEYNEVKANQDEYYDWYLGLVGFTASFSARYFDTYARGYKADGVTPRDMSNEAIRNLEKQRKNLQGIKFYNDSFLSLKPSDYKDCVVYCDPPYRGTDHYYKNEGEFPYDKFYQWCIDMSKNNTVLISEYDMPDSNFEIIWQKDVKVGISSTQKTHAERTEKLFIVKSQKDWIGNRRSTYVNLGASNHAKRTREKNDYYATNPSAVEKLLEVENFHKHIFEPAVGGGHIARVLVDKGHKVTSADIVDRGYPGTMIKDFLNTKFKPDLNVDIITNPPYKYAQQFVEKSIDIIAPGRKVAMLLKVLFLEGQKRYEMFQKYPPKYVYVFSKRTGCAINGLEDMFDKGAVAYAWFIWEKGYQGEPVIRWLM